MRHWGVPSKVGKLEDQVIVTIVVPIRDMKYQILWLQAKPSATYQIMSEDQM
jgi:hypothetical protein